MRENEFILNGEEETKKCARKLAESLRAGDLLLFTGDVGAGKTFFCREIIKFFCTEAVKVNSPTFNLLQTYHTPDFMIYHFDLYRLKSEVELYELGIEEALQNNLCLIEWPEIIEKILPQPNYIVHLQVIDHHKRCCNIRMFR